MRNIEMQHCWTCNLLVFPDGSMFSYHSQNNKLQVIKFRENLRWFIHTDTHSVTEKKLKYKKSAL